MSAAALRGLHVPGDPLVLPNAWDAATARAVAAAGFPAVATTSSGVAESLGYEDGEETPADEMLAAVRRISRVVDVPVTADLEGGYGLDPADLAQRAVAAGAAGLNFEDTDHANAPRLHDIAAQAERIGALKAAQDLVVNARIDVFLNGGPVAEGLERARAYADAGADCVYPIGIVDEATIAAFVELRHAGQRRPVTGGAADRAARRARRRQDQPRPLPPRRDARRPGRAARRPQPPRYAFVIGIRRSRPNARGVILMPGRRLAALVLGAVDEREDALDGLGRQPGERELLAARVLLDVGLEDRVERVVVGQRVLVLLVGPQLGARRPVDDRARHRMLGVAGVAEVDEPVDERLGHVLDHREAAGRVAVERRVADRVLRLVAGRERRASRTCSTAPSAGCRGSAPAGSPR